MERSIIDGTHRETPPVDLRTSSPPDDDIVRISAPLSVRLPAAAPPRPQEFSPLARSPGWPSELVRAAASAPCAAILDMSPLTLRTFSYALLIVRVAGSTRTPAWRSTETQRRLLNSTLFVFDEYSHCHLS